MKVKYVNLINKSVFVFNPYCIKTKDDALIRPLALNTTDVVIPTRMSLMLTSSEAVLEDALVIEYLEEADNPLTWKSMQIPRLHAFGSRDFIVEHNHDLVQLFTTLYNTPKFSKEYKTALLSIESLVDESFSDFAIQVYTMQYGVDVVAKIKGEHCTVFASKLNISQDFVSEEYIVKSVSGHAYIATANMLNSLEG